MVRAVRNRNARTPEEIVMTVQFLHAQTALRTEPNFEITTLFSLLGLTLTLVVLPMLGGDFGTLLALAG